MQRFRQLGQSLLLFPLIWFGYGIEVRGRKHFKQVTEPCLMISNHNMHLDWSLLLRTVPRRMRKRTTVAAAANEIFGNRRRAFSSRLLGNAFPFNKEGSGVRRSLEHTTSLLAGGWNVLIFPEGEISLDGTIKPFKSGVGWIAVRSGVEVLPMRVDVLRRGMYEGARFPRLRGRVRVTIGPPLRIPPETPYAAAAAMLEQAVRQV